MRRVNFQLHQTATIAGHSSLYVVRQQTVPVVLVDSLDTTALSTVVSMALQHCRAVASSLDEVCRQYSDGRR